MTGSNSDIADGREVCDLLILGAVVVTADSQHRVHRDGGVAIRAGRIAAVGESAELAARFDAGRRVMARGKVVTPGLINGHLHVSQHLLRGFVPLAVSDTSAYLFKWVFPYYETLTSGEEGVAATLAGCDLLTKGVTMVADGGTVRHPGVVADALATTGIRAHLGGWSWDHASAPPGLSMDTTEALDRLSGAMDEVAGRHARIAPLASTIGLGMSSDALLEGAKSLADRHGTFLDFHHSFDAGEVESHRSSFGDDVTPVEHLERLGILSDNVRLVHQIVSTAAELDAIQRTGASVVRCTGTRAARDLAELRGRGIPVGVGTDTVNVSNTSDVLRALHVFAAEIREPDSDIPSSGLSADDLFDMCTVGGARTLGVASFAGSLEPGKSADLVMFDALRPEWIPMIDPVNQLVLSADGGSVESVWIEGELVVDRGRVIGVDELALCQEAEEAAAGVLMRMGARARIGRRSLC